MKIAINGFGRIGRAFFKLAIQRPELEIVAINDLSDPENLAYLLRYDSVYGKFEGEIKIEDGYLIVNGKKILLLAQKDPSALPWKDLGIDVVIESTGVFTTYVASRAHISAGAKKVLLSAPVKDDPASEDEATVIVGVNDEKLKSCSIVSNASCTTNAGAPLIAILDEAIGIEKAILNTVHGYTSSQSMVDSPSKKDFRKARAGAINMIPTSTGAAKATTKAYPKLAGKFDGVAIRVPVPVGSLVDITFISSKPTSVEEVNNALKTAAKSDRWSKTFTVTEEQIVSTDIIGEVHASIADLSFTRVIDGNLVKVLAWYDNEMGYANTLIESLLKI